MKVAQILLAVAMALILGVPFAIHAGSSRSRPAGDAQMLIVITPHVQQIQVEFAHAFARWYDREHPDGPPARLDFRQPGGTSDILRQLRAQYAAAAKNPDLFDRATQTFVRGAIPADVMFGGGSYDHGLLKTGIEVVLDPTDADSTTRISMSEPAGFSQPELDAWFGSNHIGAGELYDPEQYWIGTALSSFGIVYNRPVLAELGLDEPTAFADLTDPRLAGWVALADPRQSGSITTTFDSILNNEGWDEGWRILRGMSANARYFTDSSTKPPIDIALGEAAEGLAIDFYGRSQAQAVMGPGETALTSRVGYADPAGAVFIDADPVSILRGGPHPELAREFVRFLLTEEAQALWQFHATTTPAGADNPRGPDGQPMGPEIDELRRMPIRRIMYERYFGAFVDPVDPYDLASTVPSKGWRSSIAPMMAAFGVDSLDELHRAWRAYHDATERGELSRATLDEMESLLYAMPTGERVEALWDELFPSFEPRPTDAFVDFSPANYRRVRNSWKKPGVARRLDMVYARIFRENYRRIVQLAKGQARPSRSEGHDDHPSTSAD